MQRRIVRSVSIFVAILVAITSLTSLHAAALANGDVGAWQTTTLPATVYGHTMVTYNNYVYVMGGNTAGPTTTVRYAALNADGSVSSWQNGTALPTAAMSATATLYNGYVYVMGGDPSGGAALDNVYYSKLNADGSLGAWQTGPSLPAALRFPDAISHNGYIYVLGGDIVSGSSSAVYYAPLNANGSIGSWQTTTALPGQRAAGTAVVHNNTVYFMGGYNSSGIPQTNTYYASLNANGTVGTWQNGTALPYATYDASALVHNNRLYLLGGDAGGTHAEVSYMNFSATNGSMAASWQTASNSVPLSLFRGEAVYHNGYFYVIGGQSFSGGPSTLAVFRAPVTTVNQATQTNSITGGSIVVTAPANVALDVSQTSEAAVAATQDQAYTYPLGLLNINLATNQTDNQVTVIFETDLTASQVIARDYISSTNTYIDIPGAVITDTTYNGRHALQLTYTLTDNGTLDSNPIVGVIEDPVGLAVGVAAASTAASTSAVPAPKTGFGAPRNTTLPQILSVLSAVALALGIRLLQPKRHPY